jgi:hypothetical protein
MMLESCDTPLEEQKPNEYKEHSMMTEEIMKQKALTTILFSPSPCTSQAISRGPPLDFATDNLPCD